MTVIHSFGEGLVLLGIVLIRFGIPIALAIWFIIALRQIRSDTTKIKIRLEELERRMQSVWETDKN